MRKSIFVLKPVEDVYDASEARQWAVDWQNWASEQSLSLGELQYFNEYFKKLGERFNLTEEFAENGII